MPWGASPWTPTSGGVIDPAAPYLSFLADAATARRAEVWVAVDERGVVGTVTYVEPGRRWRRCRAGGGGDPHTGRRPGSRGQGIGEALTRRTLDLARERGFGAVILSSSTTMHAAHRLYERLGLRAAARAGLVPAAAASS